MTRRIAIVLSLLVLAALVASGPPARAQGGGGCELDGTAAFKTPLTNDAQDFAYSFSGALSNCMSNEDGAPATGTVSAGQVLVIKGVKYQEPVPAGNGSCANGHTEGIAIAKWDNGKYSVIQYSTDSAAAAVALQGKVVPSVKLKAIKPKKGQPKSTTLKSTQYQGATGDAGGVAAALTFQPDDPTACGGDGVKAAGIQGFTGIGSAS